MRGLALEAKKQASLLSWTIKRPSAPPARVRISLRFPSGEAKTCVQIGDSVKVGQKIAVPSASPSAAVIASLSGKITAIGSFPHPVYGESNGIEIGSDGKDERLSEIGTERANWQSLSQGELQTIFCDSGLVDLSRDADPVYLKTKQAAQYVIINACEVEPYLTANTALMMSHSLEMLRGAELLRKAAGAETILIATDQNQMEAAETLKSKIYFLKWEHCSVEIFPALYPQGEPAILLKTVQKLKGWEASDICLFGMGTAYAAYEAVALQKPFYERVVTVGGECVMEPRNFWARMGSDFSYLVKSAKGMMREPRKVLAGGPMKGWAQEHLEIPVTSQVAAILALPKEVARPAEVAACTRCGICLEHCPVPISPAMITLAAEQDQIGIAEAYGLSACIFCGNCTYVCPSKRPMLELIEYARSRGNGTYS